MTVAERIRNLRMELGISQAELATKIGNKDKSTISKIESKGNDISLKDISRIADALYTTPSYLMGWDEPTKPTEEMGELLASIRKEPRMLKLAKDFMRLNKTQQETVLMLVHELADHTHP